MKKLWKYSIVRFVLLSVIIAVSYFSICQLYFASTSISKWRYLGYTPGGGKYLKHYQYPNERPRLDQNTKLWRSIHERLVEQWSSDDDLKEYMEILKQPTILYKLRFYLPPDYFNPHQVVYDQERFGSICLNEFNVGSISQSEFVNLQQNLKNERGGYRDITINLSRLGFAPSHPTHREINEWRDREDKKIEVLEREIYLLLARQWRLLKENEFVFVGYGHKGPSERERKEYDFRLNSLDWYVRSPISSSVLKFTDPIIQAEFELLGSQSQTSIKKKRLQEKITHRGIPIYEYHWYWKKWTAQTDYALRSNLFWEASWWHLILAIPLSFLIVWRRGVFLFFISFPSIIKKISNYADDVTKGN